MLIDIFPVFTKVLLQFKAMKPGAPPQASMIQNGIVPGAHTTGHCSTKKVLYLFLL
jgi:hypothetical protein